VAKIFLHRRREERVLAGHPWVYRSEIERVEGDVAAGDVVTVCDARGKFLGRAHLNMGCQIAGRILTRNDEPIGDEFWQRRIAEALARRARWAPGAEACRLAYGEADGLPGLMVDRYGDVLAVQMLTAGMERATPAIVAALAALLAPRAIFERNDPPPRRLEGLEQRKGFLLGRAELPVWVRVEGLELAADVANGQKTGLFLDQRENWQVVQGLAKGRTVLDAFCYTGGFGLHAAAGGAAAVFGIDLSPGAIDLAGRTAERNGVGGVCAFRTGNAFDELHAMDREGKAFDMVVLDPPAFTKARDRVESALRGYKEINLRALKLLRPGGILVTCSCSYHVDRETFLDTLHRAALDAGRTAYLLELRTQARDHPVLLGVRETQYLKCAILEVL
jgi:23S rRNA (cytosine1962-C5)-methyltransferase